MTRRYDLAILGGGSAGLVAAETAGRLGARVVLVDDGPQPGGECLFTGCVPSKALIASAGLAHAMAHADRLGLEAAEPPLDFRRVMERVREVIRRAAVHDSPERLRAAGVETIRARGRFAEPGVVEADGRRLAYRSAILATGSRPTLPPIPGVREADPLTNETVFDLRERPGRLAVLGGGPVGVELAQALARLGTSVDLVEAGPSLLPVEDREASELVARVLGDEGVRVHLGARAERVEGAQLVVAARDGERRIDFDRLLVTAGRSARTDDLGLERAGVDIDADGSVVVDSRLRTTGERIWAAGDVVGALNFTHVAGVHGVTAALNALFGARREVDHSTIPWVTFTAPEVARVGLTEAEARERLGRAPIVLRHDYSESDRALTEARTAGFAKLVADRRGRLLGATVVSHSAGESLAGLTRVVAAGGRVTDLATTVHPYPTFSEGPARAAAEWWSERYLTPGGRRVTGAVLRLLRAAHSARRLVT